MKKIIFIIFLIVFSVKIKAQFPSADTAYFYLFGGEQVEEFRDVANVTSDSGYISVGTTSSFGYGETDIYLVRTDWKCNTLWSRHFGAAGIDKGYAVKETYDKGFIIGGFSNNTAGGDYDMMLVKVDSNGFEQWEKKFGGTDWDFMYSLAIAPDSGFILCGETYSFGNASSDVYLIRTDKNGNLIWEKNWGGVNADGGRKIIITPDTNLIVAGYSASFTSGSKDAYVLKVNMNGDTIFTKSFGGAKDEEFYDVAVNTNDSSYVFIGYAESFTAEFDKDTYILKIDRNGNFVWVTTFGHPTGDDIGYSITEITNYNFFVASSTPYGSGKMDIGGSIMTAAGNVFWGLFTSTYGGNEDDLPYESILTKRNHYLVAGQSSSFGHANGDALLLLNDSILTAPQYLFQSVSSTSLVGIEKLQSVKDIILYPNPATDEFYLKLNSEFTSGQKIKIEISDISGRIILEKQKIVSENMILDFTSANLAEGVYYLRLQNNSANITLPLIISKK